MIVNRKNDTVFPLCLRVYQLAWEEKDVIRYW